MDKEQLLEHLREVHALPVKPTDPDALHRSVHEREGNALEDFARKYPGWVPIGER